MANAESKEQFWKFHCEAAKRSGGSLVDYCRKQGLDSRLMYAWRRRIGIANKTRVRVSQIVKASPFVEARASAEKLSSFQRDGLVLPDARWVATLLAEFIRRMS